MSLRTPAPGTLAEQVAWLVDRAALSDLLIDFAYCLDARDWDGYLANFADDAVLELPFGRFEGIDSITAHATHGLDGFHATHHISSNHAFEITGDLARTRSYLLAAHVPEERDPGRHGDAGGWYECELRRTAQGWRLTHVALRVIWTTGTDLPGAPR